MATVVTLFTPVSWIKGKTVRDKDCGCFWGFRLQGQQGTVWLIFTTFLIMPSLVCFHWAVFPPFQSAWIACYTYKHIIWTETFIKNHFKAHFMKAVDQCLSLFLRSTEWVLEYGSSNSETPTHLFIVNSSTFTSCGLPSKLRRFRGMD